MKAQKATIQRYSGGPEHSFFIRTPVARRAAIALMADPEYKSLRQADKNFYASMAAIAQSAAYEGVEVGHACETVEDCEAFAEEWASYAEDSEIPQEAPQDENPTVTPAES